MIVRSFPPILGPAPAVLVLGSAPGRRALAVGEYYAHPQNQFWPIMGELVGADQRLPYAQRVARLLDHRIAVWDVLKQCRRDGSLDSGIARDSEVANDLAGFLERHASLRAVFFNGGKSEAIFGRQVRARGVYCGSPGCRAGAEDQYLGMGGSGAHGGLRKWQEDRRRRENQTQLGSWGGPGWQQAIQWAQ